MNDSTVPTMHENNVEVAMEGDPRPAEPNLG